MAEVRTPRVSVAKHQITILDLHLSFLVVIFLNLGVLSTKSSLTVSIRNNWSMLCSYMFEFNLKT